MNDHYLKFDSEQQAETALGACGIHLRTGYYNIPERVDVCVVGTVYARHGEGRDVVFTPVPGFHVNIRGPLPSSLESYRIFPTTPKTVWA